MATRGSFAPTTWNSGAAPGISAAELQRIEDQIDALDEAWTDYASIDVGGQLFLNAASGADVRPGGDVSPLSDAGGHLGSAAVSWNRLYAYYLHDPAGNRILTLSGDFLPRGNILMQGSGDIFVGKDLFVSEGVVGIGGGAFGAGLNVTAVGPAGAFWRQTAVTNATVLEVYSDWGGVQSLQMHVRTNGDVYNVTGVYGQVSDAREKSNIRRSDRPWLADLRAVEVSEWEDDDGRTLFGLVAQQVEPIIPWLVTDGEVKRDGVTVSRKVVKHSLLPYVNTAAIQELADRVEALEAG